MRQVLIGFQPVIELFRRQLVNTSKEFIAHCMLLAIKLISGDYPEVPFIRMRLITESGSSSVTTIALHRQCVWHSPQ